MKLDSKYFDRIRTRKKRKKNAPSPKSSICQWDNCQCIGEYRAPVGSGAEEQFFLFCLDHVKKYNKGYNYFLGLSDDEVGRYQKEGVTGERFTWTAHLYAERYPSNSSFFQDHRSSYGHFADRPDHRVGSMQFNAFEILGLLSDSSPEEIRGRYKDLVKKHHPDANGGDRGSEERFQAVIQAYKILKKSGFC
ncbi:J domain-containing protein [Candidatus Liberibacter asiaticus]|uniref:Molecular chaperone DnaJ family protein n=2 Tax=Liberibacter asiaticus TaxID=34021 RepID=C6XFA5_LIBAP|nr:J domain-containing protein [Candidatus Liberibacter asiaticus]ACT57058.1 molecular chaperone DnaJ family protein [Candidatus Liberibacter asiaticus str. psy62]AGH16977.1 molecular chaperone DnaJ family protein [Candidatus Liberibacter asiaticus str. gxpsy]ALK07313.1 DnaJ domain-containing protein [Candidatus Liberibacter asiaticus]ASK52804.1 molecular chaperone DnaJ [Candidatus Liberibacter asiaticus]AWL14121.1 DnaJ domain-containing protein [Candidatus Liberibacter asiaticus]